MGWILITKETSIFTHFLALLLQRPDSRVDTAADATGRDWETGHSVHDDPEGKGRGRYKLLAVTDAGCQGQGGEGRGAALLSRWFASALDIGVCLFCLLARAQMSLACRVPPA